MPTALRHSPGKNVYRDGDAIFATPRDVDSTKVAHRAATYMTLKNPMETQRQTPQFCFHSRRKEITNVVTGRITPKDRMV